ncbi:SEC-C domain-containing protein [Frigoribacterium sp. CFBP 13729]|jgi:SEC-C motif-containing protein|uniref:YchJ family protein n=1 Tax=unclassified Frigoribacterium TaxID=2627005 RepID=UPI00178323E9|nr:MULTISPECIES: YchJ family metal-binding protein [unclassified Frigoribacterium]MBD8585273.1 SEC-C domain-containing protein [Frigoribacterium sp. CFBP 8766]MBD8611577.1 SEC-C domain-containing protein [Frigoribacterium sp. CFBP 13729]
MDDSARCPCLSGETYGACCGPLHAHVVPAPTAERLMRSRYSAFAVGDAAWLLETWHPSTRPDELELDPTARWFRLDVLRTERGGPLDDQGVVEFAAHRRVDGDAEVQREVSRFVRDRSRRWLYVDGVPG